MSKNGRTALGSIVVCSILTLAGAGVAQAHPGLVDVKAAPYLAVGNGIADDTAAINAAIAAVPAGGGILWFPAGSYRITGPLTINRSMAVQGVTRYASRIVTTTSTAGFVVNTVNAVTFSDLRIQHGSSYQTGGAGVALVGEVISGNLQLNRYSSFRNVDFAGQYVAIDIQAGVGISVTDSQFADCSTGVRINNPAVPEHYDTGDHQIIGNIFASNRVPPVGQQHYGIDHYSGGGVRILGNKFLGHSIAYRVAVAEGVSTGDTMIANNSMEGQIDRAIQMLKIGTTGGWGEVTISNNQIAHTTVGVEALASPSGNWLYDVVITGNLFLNIDFPIGLMTGNNMMVGSNVFQNGGGTTLVGITVAAAPAAQNVKIGPNAFSPGVTTHLSLGAGSCTTCTTCN